MYNNRSVKEIFALSRGLLIGKYYPAILACVTITAIELAVEMLISSNPTTGTFTYLVKIASSIIISLLTGVLIYGQSYFFLKLARGSKDLNPRDIFHGFSQNVDKAILVQLPFTLCSCITLIPVILINVGLIPISDTRYYYFSIAVIIVDSIISLVAHLYIGLSFYLLCDHPDSEVKDILNESIQLMSNKKGRLFLIYLSLVPLCIVGFLSCCIGLLWVIALAQTLFAVFYLDAIGESVEPFEKETIESTPDDYSI